jgi:hypothetical protein
MQTGADYRQQFFIVRGLLKESDGARSEGAFFITLGIAGSQHYYGNGRKRGILLQVFQDGKTVTGWQPEVENDQVRFFFLSQGNGRVSVASIYRVEVILQSTGCEQVRVRSFFLSWQVRKSKPKFFD